MNTVYPLSRVADIFCNAVDAVVATCNSMAAVTLSIEEKDKQFANLRQSSFELQDESFCYDSNNRQSISRYIVRCIEEIKFKLEALEKERDAILVTKRRLSSSLGEEVSKTIEEEETTHQSRMTQLEKERCELHSLLAQLQSKLEESTHHLQSLHSQAELALSGLNEDRIFSEQKKSESLMQELNSLHEEVVKLQSTAPAQPQMSRIALEETVLQLEKSQQRCAELKSRIATIRSQSSRAPTTENVDDLKKQVEAKQGDERKALRRMYSLIKKLSPSIHSECLQRVEEICSKNSTLVLDQEAVERLTPFSNEPAVQLIRSFVQYI